MTPKRRAPSPRRSAKPSNGTAVVLEQLHAQMNVVLEAVPDCAKTRDVDARFDAVDAEFAAVHEELRAIRHDATLHAQSSELRALEHRVLVLEQRAGE
jgi:hypothetical protein